MPARDNILYAARAIRVEYRASKRAAQDWSPHLERNFGADGRDENADLVSLVIHFVGAPAEVG